MHKYDLAGLVHTRARYEAVDVVRVLVELSVAPEDRLLPCKVNVEVGGLE